MKPADRLFQTAATVGRLVRSWLLFILVIAIGSLLKDNSPAGITISAAEPFFNVCLFLFVVFVGGRLFVMLMRGLERKVEHSNQS